MADTLPTLPPDPLNPVSPTGTSMLPPAMFKWIALGVLVTLAVLGVLMGFYPDVKGFGVGFSVLSAVAGVLGIASPGLRKATPVFLLLLLPLASCALFNHAADTAVIAAPKVVDCAEAACVSMLPNAIQLIKPIMDKVLEDETLDINATIDQVLAQYTATFIPCAIREILQAWQQAGPGAGLPLYAAPHKRLRVAYMAHKGQAHLAEKGLLFK